MEFITQYTIYCTPEQTKKALELGAPIVKDCSTLLHDISRTTYINDIHYCNPTAEEMIGWLEKKGLVLHIFPVYREKGFILHIYRVRRDNDYCIGYNFSCEEMDGNMRSDIFSTRREATIAAIDAALEYLEKQKK